MRHTTGTKEHLIHVAQEQAGTWKVGGTITAGSLSIPVWIHNLARSELIQDIATLIGIAVAASILVLNIVRLMPSRLAEERASRERQARIEQYQEDLLKAQLDDLSKKQSH